MFPNGWKADFVKFFAVMIFSPFPDQLTQNNSKINCEATIVAFFILNEFQSLHMKEFEVLAITEFLHRIWILPRQNFIHSHCLWWLWQICGMVVSFSLFWIFKSVKWCNNSRKKTDKQLVLFHTKEVISFYSLIPKIERFDFI